MYLQPSREMYNPGQTRNNTVSLDSNFIMIQFLQLLVGTVILLLTYSF